jgi:O-antigen ligase
LDIYIDGGIVGLIFLFILLATSGHRIIKQFRKNRDVGHFLRLRFAVLAVAIIYNLSESNFARMSLIWFTTLLAIAEFPGKTIVRKARAMVYPSGTSTPERSVPVPVSH